MSSLAKILLDLNIKVMGSDMVFNERIEELTNLGAEVYIGENVNNIEKNIDLVVYTGAISKDNKELLKSKELGIITVERSEFLGRIAEMYDNVISIAGTHGKTTTTAMIGEIFNAAQLNPTIHLGGIARFGNLQVGGKEFFITEACEYLNSFSFLSSSIAVITNVEADHLDFYSGIREIKFAFENFANKSKIVVSFENDWIESRLKKGIEHYSCGFEEKYDFYIYNVKEFGGGYSFDIRFRGEFLSRFVIKLKGIHNIKNAVCAIAVGYLSNIPIRVISKGIYEFYGVERRYELIGQIEKTQIIADYAHHPTEIRNSILGFEGKKVLAIFQPHTYSRTKKLIKEFSECFKNAEKVIIYKTYPAREQFDKKGSETLLFQKIKKKNKEICLDKNKLINLIKEEAENYDIVLVLGAGDIYNIVKSELK